MELKRVIRAQADIQPRLEEFLQWVPLVCQEERVVAERAHCDPDLLQIEQVLQRGNLAQQNPVGDRVRCEVGRCQVVGVPCFTRMRTEDKCVCHSHGISVGAPAPAADSLNPRSRRQLFKFAMFANM